MKFLGRSKSLVRHLWKIGKSLLGIRLLDPIQVFYLVQEGTVYPINAKAGNSSLKLTLIRKYNPGYTNRFPEIHLIDPAEVTNGQLRRILFFRQREYLNFCRDKEVRLVLRNPYDRFYSCFLGIESERNIMYQYPAQIHNLIRIRTGISWQRLLLVVCLLPNRLADKHFRPQSFYVPDELQAVAKKTSIYEMPSFLERRAIEQAKEAGESASVRLNNSKEKMPGAIRAYLSRSLLFQWRYRQDIALFKKVEASSEKRIRLTAE